MAWLDLSAVGMRYGDGPDAVVALDAKSLAIEEHEFVTIVGPSGCGKSTLLYLVGGFLQASTGQIRLRRRPITGPGRDRGIVFQRYSLFPWRTVRGNIAYGLQEQGLASGERDRIVRDHVRLVHLEGFEDRYPRELSGGMQQRIALAQTLACNPEILLMDEPFGAQTRRIWQRDRKTVLFVTHDVEEAVALGTRIVVMSARAVEWLFEPLFSFGFPLPKIALVPLYIHQFGLFNLSKVLLILTDCLFPIVIFSYPSVCDLRYDFALGYLLFRVAP